MLNVTTLHDIWGVGIYAVELYNGEPFYSQFSVSEAEYLLLTFGPLLPQSISPLFYSFLQCCFAPAEYRKSASQLLQVFNYIFDTYCVSASIPETCRWQRVEEKTVLGECRICSKTLIFLIKVSKKMYKKVPTKVFPSVADRLDSLIFINKRQRNLYKDRARILSLRLPFVVWRTTLEEQSHLDHILAEKPFLNFPHWKNPLKKIGWSSLSSVMFHLPNLITNKTISFLFFQNSHVFGIELGPDFLANIQLFTLHLQNKCL